MGTSKLNSTTLARILVAHNTGSCGSHSILPVDIINLFKYGPRREKTCLPGFVNNKGTDQPVHPRSLISTFVIRLLDNIISKLATSEIPIFYLVPVAEETGLSLALLETLKAGFVALRPIYVM